jgi:hypothetical protein
MDNKSQVHCNTCDLTFRSNQLRDQHFTTDTHQIAEAEDIVTKNQFSAFGIPLTTAASENRSCRLCYLQFPCKALRDLHVKTSQRHRDLLGCDTCNQGFLDDGDLSKHTVLHTASAVAERQAHLSVSSDRQNTSQGIPKTTSLAIWSVPAFSTVYSC